MKQSKRIIENQKLIEKDKQYDIAEAIELAKKTSNTKFKGSIEVHIRTSIEVKKTDQAIRSNVTLPHGTGKSLRIAAFVTPTKEAEAKAGGAQLVGGEELIQKIKETKKTDFDIAIAEPSLMPKLGTIAKLLGPRGIMPNPKTGTVSENVEQMLKEISGGKVTFKNDDSGNLHMIIGKADYDSQKLIENFNSFLQAVDASKPQTVKKQLIGSIHINSTMGPGIAIKR